MKLTWDEDDPGRNQITRRTLTTHEIDEADFKAYLASSTSGSESDRPEWKGDSKHKGASREKIRALLLGGDDELPEGWGRGDADEPGDVDMEITFRPGLSEAKDGDKEENTLQTYERKRKERRRKRKEEKKANESSGKGRIDDFFDASSKEHESDAAENLKNDKSTRKGHQKDWKTFPESKVSSHPESTANELALLATSNNPNEEPKHFNLKSVLKAENKLKGKGKKRDPDDTETQDDFAIDVNDDRFKALHEDHSFAIDPSNPQYALTHPGVRSCLIYSPQLQEDKEHGRLTQRTVEATEVQNWG